MAKLSGIIQGLNSGGRKKTYLYKDGVINTDLIGNLILPAGVTFADGYINCDPGGGTYQKAISVEKPIQAKQGMVIYFEVYDWHSVLNVYLCNEEAQANPQKTMLNQPTIICAGFAREFDVTNIMSWSSAYPTNYSRLKIKKIWIEGVTL